MYFVACAQIYLMAAISFERYIIISNPYVVKCMSYKMSWLIICICCLLGVVWAGAPLIGWSYYSLEGALISCSVEWKERTANIISYNVTIFLFSFVIPLFIIAFTNIKILCIVSLFFILANLKISMI
jgi:r-opsin